MAPERLEGQDADHRTDVFAFGVLVYEMLTGRRAFGGGSPAALIAAILSSEPPPLGLEGPRGPELEWLVRRCLAKSPDHRWQSMGDVQAILRRLAARDHPTGGGPPRARASRFAGLAAAALVLTGSAVFLGWIASRRGAPPAGVEPVALTISPPAGGSFTPTEGSLRTAQLALSPDGRALVFVAAGSDRVPRLWLRRFSSVVPAPLAGTEDAVFPFWSPDGRSLGFFSRGFLRTIDLAGGPASQLAAAENGRGGSWSTAGDILFTPETEGPVFRIPAAGGAAARPVTRLDKAQGENSHRWPIFLPDGQRFLFFARSPAQAGIYLASLAGTPPRLVVRADAGGALLLPDRVLFVQGGTLLSLRFNADTAAALERPVALAEGVGTSSNDYGAVSASANGAIAYASSAMAADLVWMDRAGRPAGSLAVAEHPVDFRLSPDGSALALAALDRETSRADIYVLDLNRPGAKRRLTSSPFTDASPVWAPDGGTLVFRSNRESVHDLYQTASASGPDRPFFSSRDAKYPTSWAKGGQIIAFHAHSDVTNWDVLAARTGPGGGSEPLVASRFNEMQAQFSPDGRWLAYTSDETGQPEVWVRGLEGSRTEQISVGGGSDPRWRADGGELFYIAADGDLMAVPLRYRAERIEMSPALRLFPVRGVLVAQPYTSCFDVTRDGQRFLLRVPREDVTSTPLTVRLKATMR
jgi:Tol biopolymer transport system component